MIGARADCYALANSWDLLTDPKVFMQAFILFSASTLAYGQ